MPLIAQLPQVSIAQTYAKLMKIYDAVRSKSEYIRSMFAWENIDISEKAIDDMVEKFINILP